MALTLKDEVERQKQVVLECQGSMAHMQNQIDALMHQILSLEEEKAQRILNDGRFTDTASVTKVASITFEISVCQNENNEKKVSPAMGLCVASCLNESIRKDISINQDTHTDIDTILIDLSTEP